MIQSGGVYTTFCQEDLEGILLQKYREKWEVYRDTFQKHTRNSESKIALQEGLLSALGKWGRTQMGSDGLDRILLFQSCRGTPCISKNTCFEGISTGF